MDYHHHAHLTTVADEDVRFVKVKDVSYGASWKKSGGRSAWFMLVRKIDRLLTMMKQPSEPHEFSLADLDDLIIDVDPAEDVTMAACIVQHLRACLVAEDIFTAIATDPSGDDGSVLAEVRDLRRYLLLVEAEMMARGIVQLPPTKWREVGVATNMEVETHRPGTPEDGGHHAAAGEREQRIIDHLEREWASARPTAMTLSVARHKAATFNSTLRTPIMSSYVEAVVDEWWASKQQPAEKEVTA